MIKSQLLNLYKNRMSRILFLIIVCIPMVEIFLLTRQQQLSDEVYQPVFASFLTGSSIGHAPQIILLWFLPIYLLLLGGDNAIQDYKTGYRKILISKIGRKAYFAQKLFISFVTSFCTILTSLMLNLVLVHIVFWGGTLSGGKTELKFDDNPLFNFSIANPLTTALLYIIFFSLIAGLVGMLGTSISLFFLDKKIAYAATFFVWFLLVLKKDSILLLLQPFTEYGFADLTNIFFLSLLVLCLFPLTIYVYGVKFNED
ncbi:MULTISPECIES: hypothetical protein [unclassified Exiguobacterium]|uniref:hypothetical protein n=1 Tax=unclassified Exiguobacterium TaxID=2644629 RepID=UPI001BE530FD|nr:MULTISPECIES: hypothetical protein [unclassified Exiguobacterium]